MTIFRARYKTKGSHVHIILFAASMHNSTFAKCGDFIVRAGDEFLALCKAMPGVMFLDEGLTKFNPAYTEEHRQSTDLSIPRRLTPDGDLGWVSPSDKA